MTDNGTERDGAGRDRRFDDLWTGRGRVVLLTFLVVSLPVLAGCSGLAGGGDSGGVDGTGVEVTTDAPASLESNLSAPPDELFERVAELVGVETESHPEVAVGSVEPADASDPFFLQVVGPPANRSTLETRPLVAWDGQSMTVSEARLEAGDGSAIESELIYYRMALLGRERGWFDAPDRPHDWAIVRQAYRYVGTAYAAQYRPEGEYRPRSYERANVSDYEWARRAAVEYYAYQWVDAQVDDPSTIPTLLTGDNPPSSEQFLADTDDEPMALGMEFESSEAWYRGGDQRFTTQGPVTTRAVLRTELDRETAAAAAAGWGQDRHVVVESLETDDVGVVWVHRWDSADDAGEFENATQAYLAERRTETDELRFEFRRLAPDVTVLITGPTAFTNETTVAYDTGNVTVTAGSS